MPLTLTVVWGGRWENSQRLTPSLLNQIFEQATFQLQGTIDTASAPPGGIDSSWIGNTFVSGLTAATPEGPDYLLGHDTSAGAPRKFLVSDVLSLGFAAAAVVTTLAEADEFNVVVGGVAKKAALPVVRSELLQAPNALTWTTADLVADLVLIYDTSGTEAKKITPADLVRSVTDRVLTTTGTGTAYVLSSGLSLSALATGIRLLVRFHAANGASPTLAVDGLTAKALRTAEDTTPDAAQIAASRIGEVVYDASANGGSGAWLVQALPRSTAPTMVVFDSSIDTTGGSCSFAAASSLVTSGASHGLVTGDLVWFTTDVGGVEDYFPYYAIVVTATTFKLASTKALALAGTNIALTDNTNYYLRWTANPILRANNVDGVVRRQVGRYYVDFATPMAAATYAAVLTADWRGLYGDDTANFATTDTEFYTRTTAGFGVRTGVNTEDYADSYYTSVVVFP